MGKDKYLQFVQAGEDTTDLYIYGDIRKGSIIEKIFGIDDETREDAFDFKEKLASVTTPNLRVRINSNGGSVQEGLAIYNLLRDCGKNVETVCDGFAASAASIIYCAGSKRVQPRTALLMIHNAWSDPGPGNAQYFRKFADDLEKVTQPSVEAYKTVCNISEEEIKQLMDAETWITADEALKWGFTTEVKEPDAQQSVGPDYMFNLVQKTKKLEEKIVELEKQSKPEDVNGWNAFFNA